MSAMIGPDGKSPAFDGAAWVSQDGRYWWNGAAWQPIKRRGFHPPIAVTLIVVVVLAGAWFLVNNLPRGSEASRNGMSNAKIVSPTEIQFDYRFGTSCNDLTFEYLFFDSKGHQVDKFEGDGHDRVFANTTDHFDVFTFGPAIDSHAVRFVANPTCHS